MVKLIFLGSGSAFTVGNGNFQSNMLLVNNQEEKLLIDCGSDIRFSLYKEGFAHSDITNIFISHLHSDHVGGLEYIGLTTKFDPNCQKPNLFLSKDIASEIWVNTLSGGMSAVEGDIYDINDYFVVHKIDRYHSFSWSGIEFYLIPVIHVNTNFYIWPTYGLFFQVSGLKIWITADTKFNFESMQKYYLDADIIFHDCETSRFPTPVHARYPQLLTLPDAIRSKIWLYGYHPGSLPEAEKDGFLGFVKRGQVFEF